MPSGEEGTHARTRLEALVEPRILEEALAYAEMVNAPLVAFYGWSRGNCVLGVIAEVVYRVDGAERLLPLYSFASSPLLQRLPFDRIVYASVTQGYVVAVLPFEELDLLGRLCGGVPRLRYYRVLYQVEEVAELASSGGA